MLARTGRLVAIGQDKGGWLPRPQLFLRPFIVAKDFRRGVTEMLPARIGPLPFGLVCGVDTRLLRNVRGATATRRRS